MDFARTVSLLAVGALACAGAWWAARRLEANDPGERLRAWASLRGYPVRGDGRSGPVEVLGRVGERLFTVSLPVEDGGVMLVGVDCAAPAGAAGDASAAEVHDGALVSRWTAPRPVDVDRLDEILLAMTQLAGELVSRRPGSDAPE